MSILVFAESQNNKFKKSTFEAISYAKDLATLLDLECIVTCPTETENLEILSQYGADKIITHQSDELRIFTPTRYAEMIYKTAAAHTCKHVIISQTYAGKAIAPIVAAKLNYAIVTGIIDFPTQEEELVVTKTVFSNKAYAKVHLPKENLVMTIVPNSYELKQQKGQGSIVNHTFTSSSHVLTESIEIMKSKGKVPLTEAEIVVSAGRGLKGAENWSMIEELADLLGAATACSKPVSDMEWRPHSEHVGQTGITIKPDLYIAIGISGAIQHLAGVGSSKNIVVINTDKEAPFFKAADYGIVGDAFEVVPKMIEALKNSQS